VRRGDLLALLGQLDSQISRLDEAVEGAAFAHPEARLLMSQTGVGCVTDPEGNRVALWQSVAPDNAKPT
jgi:hypothetical protein